MKQILEAQSRRIMNIIEYLSLDVDHATINELADLTVSSPKTTLILSSMTILILKISLKFMMQSKDLIV